MSLLRQRPRQLQLHRRMTAEPSPASAWSVDDGPPVPVLPTPPDGARPSADPAPKTATTAAAAGGGSGGGGGGGPRTPEATLRVRELRELRQRMAQLQAAAPSPQKPPPEEDSSGDSSGGSGGESPEPGGAALPSTPPRPVADSIGAPAGVGLLREMRRDVEFDPQMTPNSKDEAMEHIRQLIRSHKMNARVNANLNASAHLREKRVKRGAEKLHADVFAPARRDSDAFLAVYAALSPLKQSDLGLRDNTRDAQRVIRR